MKKLYLLLLFVLMVVMLPALPLLAYTYYAEIIVQETGGTSYTMVSCNATMNIDYMEANGYIGTNGTDTRVLAGSTQIPHLLATDNVTFVTALTAGSTLPLTFANGYAAQDFYNTFGYGGYVTTPDAAALEISDNGTVTLTDAYINTSAGADKYLVKKQDAFEVFVSPTVSGNVTGRAYGASSTQEEYDGSEDANANMYTAANWFAQTFKLDSDILITSVQIKSEKNGAGNNLTANITRLDGDGKPTGSALTTGTVNATGWLAAPAFNTISLTNTYLEAGYYAIIVYGTSGDAANSTLWWYDNTAPSYTDGSYATSADSGATWTLTAANDFNFKIVGQDAAQVTATSVSTGEHDVTVGIGTVEDYATHYTGAATSLARVATYANYRNAGNFWTAVQFKLDTTHQNGSTLKYVQGHFVDANNYWYVRLTGAGALQIGANAGAGAVFCTTAQAVWQADTWYTFVASTSTDNSTMRLVTANQIVSGNNRNTPANNDVHFGHYPGSTSDGFIGELGMMAIGLGSLTLQEEQDLLQGILPTSTTDYYYNNEGSGTTVTSYGSAAKNITLGGAVTWQEEIRPYWYSIVVDGTPKDGMPQNGISVADNANDWVFMDNSTTDFFPYSKSIELSVDGTQVLYYAPEDIISGTVLPNRAAGAANPGAITWGSLPAGITVTVSGLISANQPGVATIADLENPDLAGDINEPENMYSENTLAGNPLYPVVNMIATETGTPAILVWSAPFIFLMLLGFVLVYMVTKHLAVAGIVPLIICGIAVGLTVWPAWIIILGGIWWIASVVFELKGQV